MFGALRDALGRFDTVAVVVSSAAAGLVVPGAGRLSPLVTPLVVVLVYGSFRGARFDADARRGFGRLLGCVLAVAFVLAPLVAATSARYLVPDAARLGVLVAAAAPTTAGSAIVWTRLDDGDVQGVTFAAVLTMALSPLATPAVLTQLVGTAANLDVLPVLRDLAVILAGGAALSRVVPERLVTDAHVDALSRITVSLLVFVSVGAVDPGSVALAVLLGTALVAVVMTGVVFGGARAVGPVLGLDAGEVAALSFGGGMKNLGIALLVADSLDAGGAAVVVTTFYVTQQVIAGVAASW
ncbi:bile acid:sodium symporter family protein [Haloplanus sp. GCM10025708]|uniref:bile acid:sodium symporter family protein n=1 Tax=Haloferacaceae TaxID=1644056 RepID=UPI0036157FEF